MVVRIDDSNTIWLLEETERRAIATRYYEDSQVIELRYGDHVEVMTLEGGPVQQRFYVDILGNKARTKSFLRERGFSVAPGKVFGSHERQALRDYVASELGMPCVLKPPDQGCGDFVFPQIKSLAELDRIYDIAIAPAGLPSILAEAQFPTADDYRFFVCEDYAVEVIKRTPPSVMGDGVSSIRTLIDAENERRMVPRRLSVANRIWLEDVDGGRALAHQRLSPLSVPKLGQRVVLRYTSNAQYGGETIASTASVHASYKAIARRVAAHFPGRKYVWVDMLITTPSAPATPRNHVIIELSYAACYAGFLRPTQGAPINIVASIVDALFPETRPGMSSC